MSRQYYSAHQEEIVTKNIEDINSEDNLATINIMSRQSKFSVKVDFINRVSRQPHDIVEDIYKVQQCRNIVTLVVTNHPMSLH